MGGPAARLSDGGRGVDREHHGRQRYSGGEKTQSEHHTTSRSELRKQGDLAAPGVKAA